MEKITVNGHNYELKRYTHKEQTAIDDEIWYLPPGGKQMQKKVGTAASLSIFFSLVSWDIKDVADKPLLLNRENFEEYFPMEDRDALLDVAMRLNNLQVDEKKSLSEPSVSK